MKPETKEEEERVFDVDNYRYILNTENGSWFVRVYQRAEDDFGNEHWMFFCRSWPNEKEHRPWVELALAMYNSQVDPLA